jgi:hypothetical protein
VNRVSVALSLVAVLVIAALCAENRDLSGNQKATLKLLAEQQTRTRIWQAKYATASAHVEQSVDTVRVRIASVKTLRDTLRIADTVAVKEYLERTDSALNACTELANSCTLFRATADTLIASQRTQIEWWVKHDKPHHSLRTKLRERIGLTVGYGVTSAGGQVYVGPQVGLSLRLVP